MANAELAQRRLKEIEQVASGWGKLLAQDVFPDGPGLDVCLTDMEEIVLAASKALVGGALKQMIEQQGEKLGKQSPCPTCGRPCDVKPKWRKVNVRGGKASYEEPVGHCSTCRRDFFPSASGVEGRRA